MKQCIRQTVKNLTESEIYQITHNNSRSQAKGCFFVANFYHKIFYLKLLKEKLVNIYK